MRLQLTLLVTTLICIFALPLYSQDAPPRLQDLGIKIGKYQTGKWNAITDIEGVQVGHVTLVKGKGKLRPGKGPVRTGVTVVLPSKKGLWKNKFLAGSFVLNGNGEATGLMWIKESGTLETPIALTNTLNVGNVHKGMIQWMLSKYQKIGISDDTVVPVVFECDDSVLNDIRGMHVTAEHVTEAIENASGNKVEEGSVGAGTGMTTYDFKGGIGTSSRVLPKKSGGYRVGVLVNANHGNRDQLRIANLPVGKMIPDLKPSFHQEGSIVVIIATDAPLDSRQLSRLAKRAMLGLGRTGAVANHGSGDVALAFSTANRVPHYPKKKTYSIELLSDAYIDPLFEAVADATEEAILNSLLAGKTTRGRDNNIIYGFPTDRLKKLFRQHGTL